MNSWKQRSALETLVVTFGKQVPSRATVFNWYCKFRMGTASFQDETQAGAPITAATVENNEAARNLIKNNVRITTDKIQDTLGIGFSFFRNKFHPPQTSWCAETMCETGATWSSGWILKREAGLRIECCQHMQEKFNVEHSKSMWDIIITVVSLVTKTESTNLTPRQSNSHLCT